MKTAHQLLLSLPLIVLSGCNGSSDSDSSTPSTSNSFNLTSITAANTAATDSSAATVKAMTLNWDSPLTDNVVSSDENTSDITYTICQYDADSDNNCNELTAVSNTLSATITLENLIDSLEDSFFVIANDGTTTYTSSEQSLTADEITNMIGYFKAIGEDTTLFGTRVAISADGSTMAVVDSDSGNTSYAESVVLFQHTTSGWSQLGVLNPEDSTTTVSIALNEDGSRLAVGDASNETAYIYNTGTLDLLSTITSPDANSTNNTDANFGEALAFSADGTTLAIGAPDYQIEIDAGSDFIDTDNDGYDDFTGDTREESGTTTSLSAVGRVYIYKDDSSEDWDEITPVQLTGTSDLADDDFGAALSLNEDGSRLVIGIPKEDSEVGVTNTSIETDDGSTVNTGAVYIYDYDSTEAEWNFAYYLKARDNSDEAVNSAQFGCSVALDSAGTTLVVGASGEDKAFVFTLTDNSPPQSYELEPQNTEDDSGLFGYSVAIQPEGNRIIVGMPNENSASTGIDSAYNDDTTAEASGAAYSYDFNSDLNNWEPTYLKASNTGAANIFGSSVAISSIYNGGDVVIGAPGETSEAQVINGDQSNNGESQVGAVYVY